MVGRGPVFGESCWLADQPTVGLIPLRKLPQPLRMSRGIVAVISRRDGRTSSGEQQPDQDREHHVHDEAARHSIEVVAQLDALVVVSSAQTSVASLTAFAIHTGLRARR